MSDASWCWAVVVLMTVTVAAYVEPCSWYAGLSLAAAPLRCVVK
jgi:hypothetical protein